jgi:hypothetical protein
LFRQHSDQLFADRPGGDSATCHVHYSYYVWIAITTRIQGLVTGEPAQVCRNLRCACKSLQCA